MSASDDPEPAALLDVAEQIVLLLRENEIESVLIGAAAMAVYGYARSTNDLDLATAVVPTPALTRMTETLRSRGFDAEYFHPDAEDPLGGMIRVSLGGTATVDVVNFLNPWTVGAEPIVRDALTKARPAQTGSALRVVPLAHLIALKLYAGGAKSKSDVAELLRANPDLDRVKLRAFLEQHELGEQFDALERGG